MPLPVLLIPILVAAAQAAAPAANPIVVTGHSGPPFISPMGEPFRARRPGEDTLGDWFRQADQNHDGMLTVDEMVADADRYFTTLDGNHDGDIDPEELIQYEWELAPEIQVNSKFERARGGDEQRKGDDENGNGRRGSGGGRMDEGLQGGARYALLNMPEPVAAADANLDRAISLAEFRQAAIDRFQLLDRKHQGKLSLQELQALQPPEPEPGRHAKRNKDATDSRYGVPLPPGE
jgi:Ca2+-binding EF-hand superfamily protein